MEILLCKAPIATDCGRSRVEIIVDNPTIGTLWVCKSCNRACAHSMKATLTYGEVTNGRLTIGEDVWVVDNNFSILEGSVCHVQSNGEFSNAYITVKIPKLGSSIVFKEADVFKRPSEKQLLVSKLLKALEKLV